MSTFKPGDVVRLTFCFTVDEARGYKVGDLLRIMNHEPAHPSVSYMCYSKRLDRAHNMNIDQIEFVANDLSDELIDYLYI